MICFIILSIYGCSNPVDTVEVEPVVSTPETYTEPILLDSSIEDSIETREAEEEEIMERELIVNPIPMYMGYLFENGTLKGITDNTDTQGLETIQVTCKIDNVDTNITLQDFFIIDKNIYFSFTDKWLEGEIQKEQVRYFIQSLDDEITELEPVDYPAKPEAEPLVGTFGEFEIVQYEWENETFYRLMRGSKIISSSKGFDSLIVNSKGIIFSQPEDLSREAGLWFMSLTGVAPARIQDYTVIWK